MKNEILKRELLEEMPFDRWNNNKHAHIHATGYAVQFKDGHWEYEYEDSLWLEN
jgi:hypothetical protein